MNLNIKRLSLSNFKGIRDLDLEPDGRDMLIRGPNGAGKTTTATAWNYLLTGRNFAGSADFSIKTLTESGEPLHGLDHRVEAIVTKPDGNTVTLVKVYHETLEKRPGKSELEITGHTTDHYIDGVPQKKKEFDSYVEGIAAPDTWKILTDPVYFPEALPWKDRRRILLEVCGDVTKDDVFESKPGLSRLKEILGDRTVDEQRKVVAARKAEVNRDLDRLPSRIDEAQRGAPEPPEDDESSLKSQVAGLRKQLSDAQDRRTQAAAGGAKAGAQKALTEAQANLQRAETAAREKASEATEGVRRQLRTAEGDLEDAQRRLRVKQQEQTTTSEEIAKLEDRRTRKRAEFAAEREKQFDPGDVAGVCPACGQDLPEDEIEEARRKAEEEFNADRAKRLTEIQEQGKRWKAEQESLEAEQEERAEKILETTEDVARLEALTRQLEAELEEVRTAAPDPSKDPELEQAVAKVAEAEGRIEALTEDTSEAVAEIEKEIEAIESSLSSVRADLGKLEQRRRVDARVQELSDQERELAAEYERIEEELHLLDEFERAQAELLDERVNEKFNLAKFKLFEVQINGGLKPVCQVTHEGVPYEKDLNHGARILVGLDIIRTLQKHYNFAPPVWIDQAESLTSELPDMGDTQVIELVASRDVDGLRVDYGEAKKEAV